MAVIQDGLYRVQVLIEPADRGEGEIYKIYTYLLWAEHLLNLALVFFFFLKAHGHMPRVHTENWKHMDVVQTDLMWFDVSSPEQKLSLGLPHFVDM